MTEQPRYFVWRWSEAHPYRVYSVRRYWISGDELARAIWRGDDYAEGQRIAKEANAARPPEKPAAPVPVEQERLL